MGGGSARSLSRLEVPLAAAFAANLLSCASSLLGSGGLFPLQTPCLAGGGLEEPSESGGCVHKAVFVHLQSKLPGQLPGC